MGARASSSSVTAKRIARVGGIRVSLYVATILVVSAFRSSLFGLRASPHASLGVHSVCARGRAGVFPPQPRRAEPPGGGVRVFDVRGTIGTIELVEFPRHRLAQRRRARRLRLRRRGGSVAEASQTGHPVPGNEHARRAPPWRARREQRRQDAVAHLRRGAAISSRASRVSSRRSTRPELDFQGASVSTRSAPTMTGGRSRPPAPARPRRAAPRPPRGSPRSPPIGSGVRRGAPARPRASRRRPRRAGRTRRARPRRRGRGARREMRARARAAGGGAPSARARPSSAHAAPAMSRVPTTSRSPTSGEGLRPSGAAPCRRGGSGAVSRGGGWCRGWARDAKSRREVRLSIWRRGAPRRDRGRQIFFRVEVPISLERARRCGRQEARRRFGPRRAEIPRKTLFGRCRVGFFRARDAPAAASTGAMYGWERRGGAFTDHFAESITDEDVRKALERTRRALIPDAIPNESGRGSVAPSETERTRAIAPATGDDAPDASSAVSDDPDAASDDRDASREPAKTPRADQTTPWAEHKRAGAESFQRGAFRDAADRFARAARALAADAERNTTETRVDAVTLAGLHSNVSAALLPPATPPARRRQRSGAYRAPEWGKAHFRVGEAAPDARFDAARARTAGRASAPKTTPRRGRRGGSVPNGVAILERRIAACARARRRRACATRRSLRSPPPRSSSAPSGKGSLLGRDVIGSRRDGTTGDPNARS